MVSATTIRLLQRSAVRMNKNTASSVSKNNTVQFLAYFGGMASLFGAGMALMWNTYYKDNKIKAIFAKHDIGTEHAHQIVRREEEKLHHHA
jgi:hypothetical protein